MTPQRQLDSLTHALHQLRDKQMQTQAFLQLARAQTALRSALPPRFDEVLLQLLDRLESSLLFSEESCSFSQSGMFDSLQMWTEKATLYLKRPAPVKA